MGSDSYYAFVFNTVIGGQSEEEDVSILQQSGVRERARVFVRGRSAPLKDGWRERGSVLLTKLCGHGPPPRP